MSVYTTFSKNPYYLILFKKIIDKNPRRGSVIPMSPAEALRYNERSSVERVNGRLKEEFGGNNIKVRGDKKVKLHLMFGIIALFADQLIRLIL